MGHGLPLTWPELKKEFDAYAAGAAIGETLLHFYEALFQIWYSYRDRVEIAFIFKPEQIQDSLREGRFLLSGQKPPFDAALYREILAEIVAAAVEHFPETAALQEALHLEELQGDRPFLMAMEITSLNEAQLAHYFSSRRWIAEAGVEPAQAALVLTAALKPFYIHLAASIAAQTDFSLWREGYCPVCGRTPSMALLRAEDGARILECGRCHAQWQFGRLECPFCRNRDFYQLRHFSIDEFPGRRVQVCECCKGYLKTVLGKEMGRRVTLELDNIFTVELDLVARREGYQPGGDLVLPV